MGKTVSTHTLDPSPTCGQALFQVHGTAGGTSLLDVKLSRSRAAHRRMLPSA